ncbi:MAG: ATP-binding cassette domain-containing protein, partial [Clostridia bacterium]
MYALQVKNLSKQIDGKQILSDINFAVPQGEILALVGPNGAGKTTTLKCIMN